MRKREVQTIQITIPTDLVHQINNYCELWGTTMSDVVACAVADYLESLNNWDEDDVPTV